MTEAASPPDRADLIVIGGGVLGVVAALLAAETGRRVALLEADRLGGAATGAWFRILHGGMRYLQKLDIARLRSSAESRRWWMARFPEALEARPFLMPLSGAGLKRPAAFRAAFAAEAMLTPGRFRGVDPALRLARGRVLSAAETAARWPFAPTGRVIGGALWEEAVERAPGALFAALAAAARAAGATLCEWSPATELLIENGRIAGVATRAGVIRAPLALDVSGLCAGRLADRDPIRGALGFNLLLERPMRGAVAVAGAPPGPDAPMLFIQPEGESRSLAGTWYAPQGGPAAAAPDGVAITGFLSALNAAFPGLEARADHVLAAPGGLLPAASGTKLLNRDMIADHARAGGPVGLVSAIGVKYTTAPVLAARALRRLGIS